MSVNPQAPLLNIANALTVLRIVLVPVFIALLVIDAESSGAGALQPLESGEGLWRWAAAVVFFAAMVTDAVDGDVARKRNLITDFGKIADPIADKLLIGAALVMLSLLGELPWLVTILILIREIGITVLRFVMLRTQVMPASRGGKLKTLLQTAGLQLMLLPLAVIAGWLADVAFWIMMAALVVTVVTGIDYLVQALRLRRAAKGAH
ncbi:CDP-diacylglycerol--glycerol-3-phosphate 3-phosphatidyltransferase [Nesterenkonia haasae]|uniref:CDP-diacylglycerol--glycerol-3-phosphate 3-phosphatidyltransferase n=1 Tax=Nesterenkonia haasae TaxID=2587813 RepID=UPI001291284C|nr:CDP-diacylglycerol--glycerol-3-phosphate 3-phosphatidyltransferase [Nesterenkonia haasae]NDK33064.1 CDP-diacylglycerol--glycerol-3-phosphate 3-phosphatidyltransferase [Nesterenkonia haasae]